ncbi:50S ribosomal protein L15 [Bartonella sp. TP]|uniref:50S ribosomal protein L15 n=1 Tax=Bartonella sp. TP TaxID=3057550 RepID=UPI0025B27910|nr:50S ribosomal protein L15 [Bartonella sp. TP]MDN5248692.1 50S ribosomal protein L15 [Alphaproteobacteria bacterium]WJW79826.1 50S ribosomal protein L15 [Bartonella sp. TP]
MKLNELRDCEGAITVSKRVGRGIGSGKGKTAGRGVKGQKSRSGVAINGFEGGQMPIYRRLPKRGFNNIFAKEFNIISLGRIQAAIDSNKIDSSQVITQDLLKQAGLISKLKQGVKLLADGELKTKLTFEVFSVSKVALKKVEKIGGVVKILKLAPSA